MAEINGRKVSNLAFWMIVPPVVVICFILRFGLWNFF